MRVATLSISTSRALGQTDAPDRAAPALAAYVDALGGTVVATELVADDRALIGARLAEWADSGEMDLILTSGGTGLAQSDVTPEATRDVIDREAPGIPEAMRLASQPHTKYWMMSRGVAGLRGRVLIINFPGNPKAIAEAGAPLLDTLTHAMALLLDPQQH
jgi:molybdenum cofactor synthesis domain-containing protein